MDDDLLSRLTAVCRDLHTHPELSGQEHRTAAVAATRTRPCAAATQWLGA